MKFKRGAMELKGVLILGILVIVCVVGFVMYTSHARNKALAELRAAQIAREERERFEREARERRIREEEEFERKRREAKLAKEKEEEERAAAEQERKRLAAEAEAELQRRQAELRKWKDAYNDGLQSFSKVFVLARDVPSEEKPRAVETRRSFWCAFASYPEEKRLYKIDAEPGGHMTVIAHTGDSMPEPVDAVQFAARLKTERSATVTEQGRLYITGVKPPAESMFSIPEQGCDFRIIEANLKDFYPAFVALDIRAPDLRFKVRLVSGNGKTYITLGEFGYDEAIPRSVMENAIHDKLGKNALAKVSTKSAVKKPKFKRTAMLYDGEYIKKQIGGPTLVPRNYRYIGTNRYATDKYGRAASEFHAKWKALHDRAVREDEREQEIEAEYQAALEKERLENASKLAKAKSSADSEDAIESALSSCKLSVVLVSSTRGGKR